MFGGLSFKKGKKKKKVQTSAAFGGGDEEDKNGRKGEKTQAEIRAEVAARANAQGLKAQQKAQREYEKIIAEDPNAFKFDEVLEKDNVKSDSGPEMAPKPKQSQYIERMMANAVQKEFEFEKAQERMIHKEQIEEEKELGKASETFVTGAYKRRLEERRLWELEEKKKAEIEARNDVTKRGNLNGFYSGMLGVLSRPVAGEGKGAEAEGSKDKKDERAESASSVNQPSSTSGSIITESQVKKEENKTKPEEIKVYQPGDMKRKREEEAAKTKVIQKSKVSSSAIEEAKRRALERKRQRQAHS